MLASGSSTWESASPKPESPQKIMLRELTSFVEGAGLITDWAKHAHHEVSTIFAAPFGRRARIDLTPADRVFSKKAMDKVQTLRRRLNKYLGEVDTFHVKSTIDGANAEASEIRAD